MTDTKKTDERPIQTNEEETLNAFKTVWANISNSQSDRSSFISKIGENRKLYDSVQPATNIRWTGQCELVVPMLKTSRNAMQAQLMRAIFGNDTVFTIDGRGELKKIYASAIQKFLQQEIEETIMLKNTMETVLKACLDDGSAATYLNWERIFGRKTSWGDGEIKDGEFVRDFSTEKVILSDSPSASALTIENIGTIPSVNGSIQKSPGCWIYKNVTGNDLLRGMTQGIYDKDAVKKMKEHKTSTSEASKSNDEASKGINQQTSGYDTHFISNTYDIYEVYFKYTKEENPTEAAEDWVMVIHEPSQTVLSFRPNQWWHGQRPVFVFRPQLAKQGIISDSLADLAGDYQEAQTFLLRTTIDAMSLGLMPEEYVDMKLGDDIVSRLEDRTKRGPGKMIGVPNLKDFLEKYQQRIIGFTPTMAQGLQVYLDQKAQTMVGESFVEMGAKAGGNTTAREIERMIASGQDIKSQMTDRLCEELNKLGAMLLALYYQHQGSEWVLKRWKLATFQDFPDITMAEAFDNLDDMKIYTTGGGTSASSKEKANQGIQSLYTGILSNPLVVQNPSHVYNLTADLIKSFGLDPRPYIGSEDEAVADFQQQQEKAKQALSAQGQAIPPDASGAMMAQYGDTSGGGAGNANGGVAPAPPETVDNPNHQSGPNVTAGM